MNVIKTKILEAITKSCDSQNIVGHWEKNRLELLAKLPVAIALNDCNCH